MHHVLAGTRKAGDKVIEALAKHGILAEVFAEKAPVEAQPAPDRPIQKPHRYPYAEDVIRMLVEDDGFDEELVRDKVARVMFDEGEHGSTALHLYRAARKAIRDKLRPDKAGIGRAPDEDY